MPPRKSNASVTSNGAEDGGDAAPSKASKDGMSVEDLSLPRSMIGRLAKGVLPANTQIGKEALMALHKSATVFVSYIASNSNEIAQSGGKKTIAPQDVMAAMKDCEFEDFLPRLEAELKKYNETQCDKRNTYRRKVKEEKAAQAARDSDIGVAQDESIAEEGANGIVNGHVEDESEDRPVKKLKAEDGSAVPPDPDGIEDDDVDGEMDDEADEHQENEEDEDEEDGADEDEDEDDAEDDENANDDPDPDDPAPVHEMRDEALDDAEDSDSD